jgi:hypothetical protein
MYCTVPACRVLTYCSTYILYICTYCTCSTYLLRYTSLRQYHIPPVRVISDPDLESSLLFLKYGSPPVRDHLLSLAIFINSYYRMQKVLK